MLEKLTGIITKSIGGIYTVDVSEDIFDNKKQSFECKARGVFRNRNISPICADKVEIEVNDDGAIITDILPRKSSLVRPPLANLDYLVFVNSTVEPHPNFLILDKFIAIAEHKNIIPVIVFTKIDKQCSDEYASIYKKIGIDVFSIDNTSGSGTDDLKALLNRKISAFTGNTGVGKSSLLNNMYPNLNLATNEISKKLGRGKHTTRHVQLYPLDDGGYIADTPGFSSFETNQYDIIFKDDLADCFVEFADYYGKCKFQDCSHTKEKGCAIINAVNSCDISKSRHDNYKTMYDEAKRLKEWEHRK